jgi:hypothetical protein
VAKNTRRGVAEFFYKNHYLYINQNSKFDSPLIICKWKDKFGLFIHPDFPKYGFRVLEN